MPGAVYVRAIDPAQRIELTLVVRRRAALDASVVEAGTLSPTELAQRYGADPDDIHAVRAALPALQILDIDVASRRVRVAGTAAQLADAFGVELDVVNSPSPGSEARVEHRQRLGSLSIPDSLAGIVVAVLGLDDRPQARTHLRVAPAQGLAHAAKPTSYTPAQLATVYSMPQGTDGAAQSLAIIELGGGFRESDLTTYFSGLAIPTPSVRAVGVDGAKNGGGKDPNGADGEVLLDIEVAGAIAPAARLVVYFAPNTDAGFLDAISTATHASPTPTAISISWGQSEDSWTAQARTAMDDAFADAAALGVTVTVAAGDNGSSDGANAAHDSSDGGNAAGGSSGAVNVASSAKVHVDFPASSPHVLACGGTSLRANPATGAVTSETVWNDGSAGGATGGGVSDTFALPSWQARAHVPARVGGGTGRGVPDVSADADPQTGYQVYVDGQSTVFGGTSAVAPLWAALICRLAQSLGPLGLIQPKLYSATAGLRDITTGDNGAYKAGPGWDPCTGLGVPVGDALLAALQTAAAATHR